MAIGCGTGFKWQQARIVQLHVITNITTWGWNTFIYYLKKILVLNFSVKS